MEQANEFGKVAKSIYEESTRANQQGTPSLAYLQGCILLAFFCNTSEPCSYGWILIGVCTRLAYDLGLNNMDEEIIADNGPEIKQWNSVEDWVSREELRRAWWSVWELDTFASTMSARPYTIDRHRMQVLLPASDENWYSATPIASAPIGPTATTAWKSLKDSPNQDKRAWFLVTNFLMELAYELWVQRNISLQAKEDMERALSCFALILPDDFHLSSGSLVFDDNQYKSSNWIILTNIMLQW